MATVNTDGIEELNNSFLEFMLSAEDVEKATEEIYDDLVDEVLMGFVFDVHRSVKCGIADAEEGIEEANAFKIIDGPGLDVFGEPMTRKTGKCTCPNCDHIVSANRFATHLERCLGMGRNSSRAAAASRRPSSNAKGSKNCSDDENDDDWSQNKKRKRKSAKKPTKKPSVNPKDDSDDVSTSVSTSNSPPDILI